MNYPIEVLEQELNKVVNEEYRAEIMAALKMLYTSIGEPSMREYENKEKT